MPRALFFAICLLPAARGVDFTTDVHPILARRCIGCHSGAHPQGGLSFENRDKAARVLERGGVRLLSRLNGTTLPQMPPVGNPLTAAEVATIKAWLDEGAIWPDTPQQQTKSNWIAPLEPRDPPVPAGNASSPIDRFVDAYFASNKITKPEAVSDALFARRAYFDLTGLPPSIDDLKRLEESKDPEKRGRLIDSLLADNKRYKDHWISFWNDLLRNDIGVVYHGERKPITPWLARALETNMPYDQMIRELLNPIGPEAPDGFLIGVNWRGDVNASQTPFMQASQNTAQVFLGINLKCASCHDSFINKYKLREAYGLAAMFSESNELELVRCDNKTGVFTDAQFLYPQLGEVPAGLPLPDRHAAAARLFTDPRNGRVPRTLVNRYWQRLFGRGLVEPVDEMDAEPWNADLLDWLASDFAQHGYDLKRLLALLMKSNAYQMVAVATSEHKDSTYQFRGPVPRRITAEEFVDTVSAVTGEWRTIAAGDTSHYARDWQLKSSPLTRAMGRPIRDQVFTTREIQPTTFQALELVNGANLGLLLRRGARRLLNQLPEPPQNLFDSKVLHKGQIPFDVDVAGVKQLWIVMEDAGSYDPMRTIAGLAGAEFATSKGPLRLADQPTLDKVPVQALTVNKSAVEGVQVIPLGRTLIYNIEGLNATRFRGSVAVDDSGQESDVGATVRLFVFGAEPDHQQLAKVSGERPVAMPAPVKSPDQAIQYCYRAVLARDPSPGEIAIARRYLGDGPVQPAGLEDLLWSLLLHPEFQYIW
jgi:hypothetical protein